MSLVRTSVVRMDEVDAAECKHGRTRAKSVRWTLKPPPLRHSHGVVVQLEQSLGSVDVEVTRHLGVVVQDSLIKTLSQAFYFIASPERLCEGRLLERQQGPLHGRSVRAWLCRHDRGVTPLRKRPELKTPHARRAMPEHPTLDLGPVALPRLEGPIGEDPRCHDDARLVRSTKSRIIRSMMV